MGKKIRIKLPGKAFKGKMGILCVNFPYWAFLDVSVFRTGPKLKSTNRKEADF